MVSMNDTYSIKEPLRLQAPFLSQLVQTPSIPGGWWTGTAAVLALYCIYEQISFAASRRRAGFKSVPGPQYAVPLVGCVIAMVRNPYQFWEDQRKYSFPGLSWNSLCGKFMIFTTDAAISRRVFSYNDPETLLMAVHPSGKNILGESNLAFMHGPPHKAIRKSFLSLFTRKALATYVELQDGIIREHLRDWQQIEGEREIRLFVRDLNVATSRSVFAGPYVESTEEKEKFGKAFLDMTEGFLALPICIPGTAVWRARRGRLYILDLLEKAAARSKTAMKEGNPPRCLMDFWAQRCLEEIKEAAEQQVPPHQHTTDRAMADTIMDFLFASQDATTAAVVWVTVLMADYPDILQKVREEQGRLRPDITAPITGEVLNDMVYTRQVVKEVLRFRPPAPMVPQGFSNPSVFDPDRFSPERKEDIKYQKNFLTFGHGPHYCVGKDYAVNQIICYLANLSTSCEWTRRKTKSDEADWLYLPTIYPADALITLKAAV
ncbi:hypothetical protein ABBQ32_012735 [Trebouxia sp. C0010 RCD-2024]